MKTKICVKCLEEKDLLFFKSKPRNKSGYSSICNKCNNVFSGIYKITSPTGRVYIGQAIDIRERINQYKKLHNCKFQPLLWKSFEKHGVENHTFEIIEECEEQYLNCRERFWQDEFDVLNEGLNCILTECGELKATLSEETRKKQGSKGDKNYFYGKKGGLSPWYGVKGEDNPNYGRPAWNKGLELHQYRGENNPNYGKQRTEETKLKISNNRKNNQIAVGGNNPRARKVIDTLTKKVFSTIKEACNTFKIDRTTFNKYMKNKLSNKTTLMFLEDYKQLNPNFKND